MRRASMLSGLLTAAASSIFTMPAQAQSAPVAPLPSSLSWSGVLNSMTLADSLVDLSLTHVDGKLTGTARTRALFQDSDRQFPAKGSVKDGRCTISFGGQTFKGECSAAGFNGADRFLGKTYSVLALWPDGAARLSRAGSQFPAKVTFTGISKATTGSYETPEILSLSHRNGVFNGILQSQYGQMPVAGYAIDGTCTFMVNMGSRYVGPCNGKQFSGQQFDGSKSQFTFAFKVSAAPVRMAQNAPSQTGGRCPAGYEATVSGNGSLLCNRTTASGSGAVTRDACMQARENRPATCFRQEVQTGYFDYIPGEDIEEEQPRGRASQSAGTTPPSAGPEAPAGTQWNYGRNRWVVPPGGGCAPEQRLWKGYCFGAVIAHLRRNPNEKSVVAITLSHRVPIGTWIGNDTPVRYNYIEVFRQGDGFAAKENRHGRAVVRIPPGCHFSPLEEGFVLTGPGPQGLREAALFRCP